MVSTDVRAAPLRLLSRQALEAVSGEKFGPKIGGSHAGCNRRDIAGDVATRISGFSRNVWRDPSLAGDRTRSVRSAFPDGPRRHGIGNADDVSFRFRRIASGGRVRNFRRGLFSAIRFRDAMRRPRVDFVLVREAARGDRFAFPARTVGL